MGICVTCGNDYEPTFTITKDHKDYEFDSFECAIEKLAPSCEHCNCRVIGHGVREHGKIYCCDHCLRQS